MFSSKCAEVFCLGFENFSIECTDCHLKTNAFQEFVSHYQEIHCDIHPKIKHEEISEDLSVEISVVEPNQADQTEHLSIKHENVPFEDEYELDGNLLFESDDNTPLQELLTKNPLENSQNVCPVCGKKYVNRQSLRSHLQRFHPDYKMPETDADCEKFTCPHCPNKSFKTKKLLQRHKREEHQSSVKRVNKIQCLVEDHSKDAEITIKTEENTADISISEWDNKSESSRSKDENLTNAFSASGTDDDWQPEKEKESACPACDKTYVNRRSLKKHILRNHPGITLPRLNAADQSTSCADCNKEYSSRKALQRHRREVHNTAQVEKYQCPHCEKQFTTQYRVTAHLRYVHKIGKNATDLKVYPCTQCDRVFHERYMLKRHEVRHAGIRNYICHEPNCGQAFFDVKAINSHRRHVHIGTRKFVCDICGFSTKTGASLQTHIRTHTGEKPFKCDQCDKRFTTSAAVIEHKVIHNSHIRPHVCDVCGKAFARPKALYHHKPLHLGIKKFVCKICGKAYAQQAGLSAHKRSHTLENFGESPHN